MVLVIIRCFERLETIFEGGPGTPFGCPGADLVIFLWFWVSARVFGYFWLVWGVPVVQNVAKGKQFDWVFPLPQGGRSAQFKRPDRAVSVDRSKRLMGDEEHSLTAPMWSDDVV